MDNNRDRNSGLQISLEAVLEADPDPRRTITILQRLLVDEKGRHDGLRIHT